MSKTGRINRRRKAWKGKPHPQRAQTRRPLREYDEDFPDTAAGRQDPDEERLP